MLTGVLVSVVAAAILGGVGAIFNVQPVQDGVHGQLSIPGLIRVAPKTSLTPDEWISVMDGARHEFILAGHTLGRWCGETHRDMFESNILRLLNRHGSVKLLTLAPGSPHLGRLKRATERDYTKAVNDSREFLSDLLSRLSPEQRSRLTVSILPDHAVLPYMLVGNERRLITAASLSSHDSDDVLVLGFPRLRRRQHASLRIATSLCAHARRGARSWR